MKEERIKFYRPRMIALVGLAPMPTNDGPQRIELFESCEGWILGFNQAERNQQEAIEVILGEARENECHPFVKKNVGGCEEVELILRYKD